MKRGLKWKNHGQATFSYYPYGEGPKIICCKSWHAIRRNYSERYNGAGHPRSSTSGPTIHGCPESVIFVWLSCSIIKKNTYPSRPATATTRQSNRKSISRRSIESDSVSSRKPSRMSLEGKQQKVIKRVKPDNEEKSATSKLPVRRSLTGGETYRVTRDEDKDLKITHQRYNRPSGQSQMSAKQDSVKSNRPNTASSVRRITRSMAAKFSKPWVQLCNL